MAQRDTTQDGAAEAGKPGEAGLRWGVEQRLAFIESRLFWDGQVNRADIAERFGVSINQASGDLTRYQSLAPANIAYDKSGKRYRATDAFRPRFFTPNAQAWLAELRLLGDAILAPEESRLSVLPPFDVALTPMRAVEPGILRAVLWAIRDRQALHIRYQSMSTREPSWRWVEPHALAFDGFRWHMRVFCRRRQGFFDFVLGRVAETGGVEPATADPAKDDAWHTRITLEIAPHNGLSPPQRAAIARDYGMTDERLVVSVRGALLDYTLRRLGLDIDPDHRAPQEQHIMLANRKEILDFKQRQRTTDRE